MLTREINIHIEEDFAAVVDALWVRRAAEVVLDSEGMNVPLEVGIVIADDETVRKLNNRYRGLDETTDVLSFSFLEGTEEEVVPPNELMNLGEVIVSYPQAERQAAEANHPVEQEISLLIIHGVLHLLGYDHEKRGERQRMRSAEGRALSLLSPLA